MTSKFTIINSHALVIQISTLQNRTIWNNPILRFPTIMTKLLIKFNRLKFNDACHTTVEIFVQPVLFYCNLQVPSGIFEIR